MRQFFIKSIVILILMASICSHAFAQDAQSLINQGESLAQRKMWKQAAEMFQKAVALQPQNPRAHNDLGYVYQEMEYYKEALQEYEIALKIKPEYPEALQNMLSGVTAWSQNLIDHGQSGTAVEILNEAIKRFPTAGELYFFLGTAYWNIGKLSEALDQWKKAAKINPNSSTAYVVKAIECSLANDLNGAIANYKKAIEINPDNAYARNMLGILYVKTGKLDEAIKEFEAAIKSKPNFAEPYINLGVIFEKQGKIEEALKYYKTAAIKNPYSYKAASQQGTVYFKKGLYFDAESWFRRALRISPLSSEIHCALAFTLDKQNKKNEAVQEFETALTINPNNVDALVGLGIIFASSGKDDLKQKARELFQKAIEVDPNSKLIIIAKQKLAELGPGSPVATNNQLPIEQTNISCESPDGDFSFLLQPKWQNVPNQGEGADKFLWIFAQPDKGITMTFYKPQRVPTNNLGTIKDYAVRDAEKKGCKKENETPVKIGGQDGFRIQFTDSSGSLRYLFITVKNNKAFIIIADMKDGTLLPEAEEIINTIQIK